MSSVKPVPADAIPEISKKSTYPEPFASMMNGRVKRKLGDFFGLVNYGVNLTKLAPGGMSALKHHHLKQDEFIYILAGTPTLVYGDDEYQMTVGDCFGFKCGNGVAHQLVNRSDHEVTYLEIGDRTPGDRVDYPDDDIQAVSLDDGSWTFLRKDGSPY